VSHPDLNDLLSYCSESLEVERQVRIDRHLADCSACAERVRSLIYLRENFEEIGSAWSAAEHGMTYRQWRMALALARSMETTPAGPKEKALDWLNRIRRDAAVATRVLLNRSHKVACLAKGALSGRYAFELNAVLPGVGSSDEFLKAERRLRAGSDLLSEDRDEEALRELKEASKIDARTSQAAVSQIHHGNRLLFQIVADSRRGVLFVKFHPQANAAPPVLAFLLCKERNELDRTAEFLPVEGEDYLLAEFKDLASGAYRLVIDPVWDPAA